MNINLFKTKCNVAFLLESINCDLSDSGTEPIRKSHLELNMKYLLPTNDMNIDYHAINRNQYFVVHRVLDE